MNLCTNASHAMLDCGGELAIRLRREDLWPDGGEEGDGRFLVLEVEDSGCGIEPETMERIFEPFFTTKPVGKGSGMGLAVVHGIVTTYGGTVILESEPGIGTLARVRLPVCDDGIAQETEEVRGAVIRGTGRVLFVDDEEPICMSVASMLESIGYEVDACTRPLEALDLFTENPVAYAAAISDINMPEMGGDELARRILKIREDLPILFVTGYSDTEVTSVSADREYPVIPKPFKKSELSRVLAAIIRGAQEP